MHSAHNTAMIKAHHDLHASRLCKLFLCLWLINDAVCSLTLRRWTYRPDVVVQMRNGTNVALRAVACWRVSIMVVENNSVLYLIFSTSLLLKNPGHRFTLCLVFSPDKCPLPGRCATLPPASRLFSSVALIYEQLHSDDSARHDVSTACLRLSG
jgi:hypothetical protein